MFNNQLIIFTDFLSFPQLGMNIVDKRIPYAHYFYAKAAFYRTYLPSV